MSNERRVYQHYHTKDSGSTPSIETLYDGEIAVNMSDEQLFIKNTNNKLSVFRDDKFYQNILSKKISSDNIKTVNGESLLGNGNITVATDANVMAVDDEDIVLDDVDSNTYVKYVTQTLTNEQKAQARTNIGALSENNIKTINGESIIGEGDLTIEGGSSSGNSAYSEVSHGTSDTTFTITPNIFHIWDEVSSLTITLGAETSGVANEYIFQFTSGSEPTTLSLPDDIKWTGGETPTIEADKIYQISILKGLGSVLEWDNVTIVENFISVSGNTLTFEYPTASELTIDVYGRTTGAPSSSILTIPSGVSSYTASNLTNIIYINSVSPSFDEEYHYTYNIS